VADGTIFEHEGLQAAAIVTIPFVKTADSMARRNGYPQYRYVAMPHPIGNLRPDQIRRRAEDILPEVLSILGVTESGNGATPA
jgi:hypothetical protein